MLMVVATWASPALSVTPDICVNDLEQCCVSIDSAPSIQREGFDPCNPCIPEVIIALDVIDDPCAPPPCTDGVIPTLTRLIPIEDKNCPPAEQPPPAAAPAATPAATPAPPPEPVCPPASQGFSERRIQSGPASPSTGVSNTGDNANLSPTSQQAANTGNVANEQGVVQSCSEADDIDLSGSSLTLTPSTTSDSTQTIDQAAAS